MTVDLAMPTAGGDTPTRLDAPSSGAPFCEKEEVDAGGFQVTASLTGKKGTVRVELPSALWSKVVAKQRYAHGKLLVRTPWGEEASAELVVHKQLYRTLATPNKIRLDLPAHGKTEVRQGTPGGPRHPVGDGRTGDPQRHPVLQGRSPRR